MRDIVLITGGLGYVGGRISRFLAENTDYFIRIGSRSKGPKPEWLSNGEIVRCDLEDDESLDKAAEGVRYIIHLAALNEIDSSLYPEKAVIINTLGTVKLLKYAEKYQIERFIYFSTAHVYGVPLIGNITEETLAKPVHPYAITHKTSEDFVLAAKSFKGIVLRLSNSFGVPISVDVNRWTLIVNDLCRQAVRKKELVLKSSGLGKRDFITLNDVQRATLHLLELDSDKLGDKLFNLGGESTLRILDMAERIAKRVKEILGFSLTISRKEDEVTKDMSLNYSIDKLKATGFELNGDMDLEIDNTLKLCKEAFSVNV